MNDTIEPTRIWPSTNLVSDVKSSGNFTIEAPTITGNESRNAKSEATEWFSFRNKPALMVTPKRLIPANRARLCPNPIANAVLQHRNREIHVRYLVLKVFLLL
jgi:hypothetical protein